MGAELERPIARAWRDWKGWFRRFLVPDLGLSVLAAAAYLALQLRYGGGGEGRAAVAAFVLAVGIFVAFAIAGWLAIWMTAAHRVVRDRVLRHDEQITTLHASTELSLPSPEERAIAEFTMRARELYERGGLLRDWLLQINPAMRTHTDMPTTYLEDVDDWRHEVAAVLQEQDSFLARNFVGAEIDDPLPSNVGQLQELFQNWVRVLEKALGIYSQKLGDLERLRATGPI